MSAQITVTKWLFEFTGQAAHLLAGYTAISIARKYTSHKWQLYITGIALAAAAFKEFVIDANFESVDTRGSDLLDFSMYATGIALGWIF